jgi:Uma2 family endonuclease
MGALMSVDPHYEWPRPPEGGYTSDDLDRLPNLPPHTELIDGSLVFVSAQTTFHMRAIRWLVFSLLSQAPEHMDVFHEFTVELGRRNRLEPDVLVVRAGADTGPKRTKLQPEDVLLAVEVVSEESVERDREAKPRKYAAAGIPHFWRVEEGDDGLPVVFVYELDPATRAYGLAGIYHDQLKLRHPFDTDIDLTAINQRPPKLP